MAKKPTGLNKKVSSIFSGLPTLDNQEEQHPVSAANPASASEQARSDPKQTADLAAVMLWLGRLRGAFNVKDIFQGLFQGERPVLIFDVGRSRRKAALVQKNKTPRASGSAATHEILGALEHEFSAGPKGERLCTDEILISSIRTLAHELDPVHKARVGLTVEGESIFVQAVAAPSGPKKDWAGELRWQLAETVVFPLEEAELSWCTCEGADMPQALKGKIIVAAFKKDEQQRWIKIFRTVGRPLERVIPLPLALESLMQIAITRMPGASLVMDIGAQETNLCFFQHGRCLFSRQAAFGPDVIFRELMCTLRIDGEEFTIGFEEATTLIQTYRLLSTVNQLDPEQPKRSQLAARLRPIMEKLVNEVRRSIAYFQTEFSAEEVKHIYLLGGGASLEGIDRFLENALRLPVVRLNLAEDFTLTSGKKSPANYTFGPVLGAATYEPATINFADWQDRWHPAAMQINRVLKVATLCIFFIGALGWSALAFQKTGLSHQHADLKIKLDAAGPYAQKLAMLETLNKQTAARASLLEHALGAEPYWGGIFRALSHVTPKDVLLERFEIKDGDAGRQAVLEGYVRHGVAQSDTVISIFLNALNDSPYFDSAALLNRSQLEDENTTRAVFSIGANLV